MASKSRLSKHAAAGILVGLAVGLTSVAPRVQASEDVGGTGARRPAPAFTLTAATKKPIRLADYKGKVLLLDFWATWCTGCKVEIPWYEDFAKRYKQDGLAAVGVALDDDGWTSVKPYLAAHAISYPIGVADMAFAERFGVAGALPVTLLIDRRGRIADVHAGMVDKDAWEQEIRALLAEPR
jgi:peroxiredoxin